MYPLAYKSLHFAASSLTTQFLVSHTITLNSISNFGGGYILTFLNFLAIALGITSIHICSLPANPEPFSVGAYNDLNSIGFGLLLVYLKPLFNSCAVKDVK